MDYPKILLKRGDIKPAYVRELKQKLNALGYGPLDESNPTFGTETEKLVKEFQTDKLLNPDGVVGPLTWHRLFTDRLETQFISTNVNGVAVEVALSQLYVREKTGKNDGKEVELYLGSVHLKKGFAWCVAFIYYCFKVAAERLGVQNRMIATAGVLDLWNRTPKEYRVMIPQKGDIGIMDFGGGKGHAFLVKKVVADKVLTIEGNTSGDPTSAVQDRDGQGVYERIRPMVQKKLLGYIRLPS